MKGGNATLAGTDCRIALSMNKSITHLDLSDTGFLSGDAIPMLGAICRNSTLKRFVLRDLPLDEPSCLQMAREEVKQCRIEQHEYGAVGVDGSQ